MEYLQSSGPPVGIGREDGKAREWNINNHQDLGYRQCWGRLRVEDMQVREIDIHSPQNLRVELGGGRL